MNQSSKADAGNMPTGTEDAFKVPDCLCPKASIRTSGQESIKKNLRFWIKLIQETSSILLVKNTRESPGLLFEWLNVLNLNEQNVAGLGSLNIEWSR